MSNKMLTTMKKELYANAFKEYSELIQGLFDCESDYSTALVGAKILKQIIRKRFEDFLNNEGGFCEKILDEYVYVNDSLGTF